MYKIEVKTKKTIFEKAFKTFEEAIMYLHGWSPRMITWVRVSEYINNRWQIKFYIGG